MKGRADVRAVVLAIAAGAATPFVLGFVNRELAGAPDMSAGTQVVAGILFASGLCAWRPVRPFVYAATLAVSAAAAAYFFVPSVTQENTDLRAFGAFGFAFVAGILGLTAALCATVIRRAISGRWPAPVLIAAAAVLVLATRVPVVLRAREETRTVLRHLETIRRAEIAYAAARRDHSYTCDGRELASRTGFEWTETGPSSLYAEGHVNGFWLHVRCEPSSAGPSFRILADATWRYGPAFTMDADGHLSRRTR